MHKQAYREHQRAFSKSLREAWSQFYSNIIKENPGNSKQLFSTINHLLKPLTAPHIETTEEQCNNFMAFFSPEIDSIHAVLSGCLSTLPILTVDPQSAISQPLHRFPVVSQQEVKDIVKRMKPSTCALELFPTALVKTNISIWPLGHKAWHWFALVYSGQGQLGLSQGLWHSSPLATDCPTHTIFIICQLICYSWWRIVAFHIQLMPFPYVLGH